MKGIVHFVNLSHVKAKNGKVQSREKLKGEHWKREALLESASNRTKSKVKGKKIQNKIICKINYQNR
jgi:hypothetical protein